MSDYRDDHDALTERVTTLQGELDGAREELERTRGTADERVEKLAAEVAASRERLGEMAKELEALRGSASRNGWTFTQKYRRFLLSGAALLGLLLVFAMRPSGAPSPPIPAVTVTLPAVVPPVPTPKSLEPTAKQTAPPAAAPPRSVQATWPARVTLATGGKAQVGATCSFEAEIVDGAQASQLSVGRLVVRCGNVVRYDSREAAGIRMTGDAVQQQYGKKEGTVVFDLAQYKDTGTGEVAQVTIDGSKGRAYLWHDYPDAYRIELAFSRASAPVETTPLGSWGGAALSARFRVRTITGRSQPAPGSLCTLHEMPEQANRCWVTVDCGAAGNLYGPTPFDAVVNCNALAAAKGNETLVLDDTAPSKDDDDPRMHFAAAGERVLTIADEPKSGAPWAAELLPVEDDAAAP